MIKVFTLEVLIFFVLLAFVIGGLVGIFFMCCFIAGKVSDDEPDSKRK